MNLKDRSMICRMAGNIAGPMLAQAFTPRHGGGGISVTISSQEIEDVQDIVAAASLKCAMRIVRLAEEKLK